MTPEVGVSWSDVVDAFMVALVVIVIDESVDLVFEVAGQVIIFQQDPVFQRLMPALDLALCLRVIRRATDMVHFLVFQPFCQISGDVGRAVVVKQP